MYDPDYDETKDPQELAMKWVGLVGEEIADYKIALGFEADDDGEECWDALVELWCALNVDEWGGIEHSHYPTVADIYRLGFAAKPITQQEKFDAVAYARQICLGLSA